MIAPLVLSDVAQNQFDTAFRGPRVGGSRFSLDGAGESYDHRARVAPGLVPFVTASFASSPVVRSAASRAGVRQRLEPSRTGILDLSRALVCSVWRTTARGVTAAFTHNILSVVNPELGADYPGEAFHHRPLWNCDESRMGAWLEADRRMTVSLPGAGGGRLSVCRRAGPVCGR